MELQHAGGRSRRRSAEACPRQPLSSQASLFKRTVANGPGRRASSQRPRSRTRSPPAHPRAPAARAEDGYGAVLPPAEHEPLGEMEAAHGRGNTHLRKYSPTRNAPLAPSPLSPTLSLPPHLASYSRHKKRHSRRASATPRSRNAGGMEAAAWQAAGVPTPAGAAVPPQCPVSPLQLPPHLASLQLPRPRESLRSEGRYEVYQERHKWEPEEPWNGREPASQSPGRGQATIDFPVGDRCERDRHSPGSLLYYDSHSSGSGEQSWPSPSSPRWRSREHSPAPRPAREHSADRRGMAVGPSAALPLGSHGAVAEPGLPQLQRHLASGAAGQAPGRDGGAPPADAGNGGAALETEASREAPAYPLDAARAWYWDAKQDRVVVGLAWELLERMRQERVAARGR